MRVYVGAKLKEKPRNEEIGNRTVGLRFCIILCSDQQQGWLV